MSRSNASVDNSDEESSPLGTLSLSLLQRLVELAATNRGPAGGQHGNASDRKVVIDIETINTLVSAPGNSLCAKRSGVRYNAHTTATSLRDNNPRVR